MADFWRPMPQLKKSPYGLLVWQGKENIAKDHRKEGKQPTSPIREFHFFFLYFFTFFVFGTLSRIYFDIIIMIFNHFFSLLKNTHIILYFILYKLNASIWYELITVDLIPNTVTTIHFFYVSLLKFYYLVVSTTTNSFVWIEIRNM